MHSAFAQQDTAIIRLEKLKAAQGDDTGKVTTLLKLAFAYFIGPKETIPLAKTYSEDAMRLSEKLGFETGKGRANMTLGMIAFRGGNIDQAISLTDKALGIFQHAKDDRACGQACFYQGCNLWVKGDVKKAQVYFRLAVQYSGRAGDNANLASSYDNAGMCYHSVQQYDSALVYYNRALQIKQIIKDSASMGGTYLHLAALYQEQTNFTKAIDMQFTAIQILSKTHRWEERVSALEGLGALYRSMDNYTQAKKYLLMAEEESKQSGAVRNLPSIYSELGDSYLNLKDTNAAKAQLDKGLELLKANGKGPSYSQLLMLRGDCERDNKKAIAYYEKAWQEIKTGDDKTVEFDLIYSIAMRKMSSGDTTGVWQLLTEAYAIAQQVHSFNAFKNYYSALSLYYEKTGALQQSLTAYHKQMDYTDSVNRQEFNTKLAIENAKFDAEGREAKITVLEQDKKIDNLKFAANQLKLKQRNIQFGSIAVILLLLLVSGILWYSRQMQKNKLAVQNAQYKERMRIADDMHDDLGSGLSKISMMAELGSLQTTDTKGGQTMQQIGITSREMVDNMRHLIWMLNPGQNTLENLITRIREFCADYVDERTMQLHVDFPDAVPDIHVNEQALRNIFLTLKESVHNVLKHAHASELELKMSLDNDTLAISIRDNGSGFDKEKIGKAGNGLRTMASRMEEISGTYSISSSPGQGTEINITVAVDKLVNKKSKENTSFV